MGNTWRRALWGYRVGPTDRYVHALETRLNQQHTERLERIQALKDELSACEAQVRESESGLRELQAEYFRLAGELTALTQRSQKTVENAELQLTEQESDAEMEVEARRRYNRSLLDTIRNIPRQIESIIEEISQAIAQASTPANARPPDTSSSPVESEGRQSG